MQLKLANEYGGVKEAQLTKATKVSMHRAAHTYSSVPNRRACTIINFGGKSPTYMSLFGPTGLLILKKNSHLHVYSALQVY